MPLPDPHRAAREAAAPVSMEQRPPQRRRNRPRPGANLHDLPIRVVPHHHPARVTRQPLRRSRGNVAPLFQHGLAGLLRIRQHRGVHMHHHLVALPRGPGVELVMQRRLGQQGQRVRLLLQPGRRLCGRVGGRQGGLGDAALLVQRLARRGEGPQEQHAHFRRQAPTQHHGAILVLVDVERAARVMARRLASFGLSVHAAPAPHDALHVDRRPRAPHRQQPGLGLRGRHAGDGADLGVGELAARQGLGQGWQGPEGAGHPDVLPGGARGEADAPGEPLRTGAEAGVPAAPSVELADQIEQAGGRRVEVRGELRDLVAQAIELRDALRRGLQRGGKVRLAGRHGESSFLLGRL